MEFKKSSTVTPAMLELIRLRAEEAEKSDQRERIGNVMGIKEMKIIQSGVVAPEEELTELEKLQRDHAIKRDEMKKKAEEDLQKIQDAIEEEKRKEKVLLFLERCSRKQQKQIQKEKEKENEKEKERVLAAASSEEQESDKGSKEEKNDTSCKDDQKGDNSYPQNEIQNENENESGSRGDQRLQHRPSVEVEVIELDVDSRVENKKRKSKSKHVDISQTRREFDDTLLNQIVVEKEVREEESDNDDVDEEAVRLSESKKEKARREFDRWEIERERELDERKVLDAEQESIARGAVFQVKMMEHMQNSEQSEINMQRNKDWQAKRYLKATPQKVTVTTEKHSGKKKQAVTGEQSTIKGKGGDKGVQAVQAPEKMNRAERRKLEKNKLDEAASSSIDGSADGAAGHTADMLELQRQHAAQRDDMKRKIEGELKKVEQAIAAEIRKGLAQSDDAEPDNDCKPDRVKKEKSKDKVKPKKEKESSKKHTDKKEKALKEEESGGKGKGKGKGRGKGEDVGRSEQSDSDSEAVQAPEKMNRAERRKSGNYGSVERMSSSGMEGSADETAGHTADMLELQRQHAAQRDDMKRKIEGELKKVEEAIAAEKRKGQQRVQQDEGEQEMAKGEDDAIEKERKKERDRLKRKLWNEKSKLKWANSSNKRLEGGDGEEERGKSDKRNVCDNSKKTKVQGSRNDECGHESELDSSYSSEDEISEKKSGGERKRVR